MTSSIHQAASYIKQGHIIVYPTDTLYAIGVDAFNESAVHSVFLLKNRPFSLPLPIAVSSLQQMEMLSTLTKTAKKLVTRLLPGPLTIIAEKKPVLSDLLTAGNHTIAVRIPNDPLALQLLQICGPLTVTSANIHHTNTPFSVEDIKKMFPSSIAFYIDDGQRSGQPSTIVDCTTDRPKILREGTISLIDILSEV
jgi:L-threonylcarbamoyladenylate synthase